jgi:probable F420-dependent oxidoreductase
VRVGAIYPQHELGGDPVAAREFGAFVESAGFEHLLAYDHTLGALHAGRTPPLTGPYTENDPFHDPFVLFAYLAGRTTTLRFVTGVLILPQRQTALVARQAADLALLSGGRLVLGVGVGWNPVEYGALGVPFACRGRRLDEQIVLLRRLWTEKVVDFAGEFHTVDRAGSAPRPTAPVPLWIGGFNDTSLQRAARLADGFLFRGLIRETAPRWERLQALLAERGRPVDAVGAAALVLNQADPAEAAREVARWAEIGGTHASIGTLRLGFGSRTEHERYLTEVAAELDRLGLPLNPPGD